MKVLSINSKGLGVNKIDFNYINNTTNRTELYAADVIVAFDEYNFKVIKSRYYAKEGIYPLSELKDFLKNATTTPFEKFYDENF